MAEIILEDEHAVSDLVQFMQRLDRAGGTEVRLRASEMRLSILGSTFAPSHLDDPTPLVLVHRGMNLGNTLDEPLDVVVETRAVLDRLAHVDATPYTLPVPPVNLTAVWAGMLPPKQGWKQHGSLDASSLARVAQEGAERVASMLPSQPGQPLVDQARRSVWSLEIAPGVPAAAGFALDALGFLRDGDVVTQYRSRTWIRLATRHGEVFVRSHNVLG